jgi:hypothetical protein
LTKSGFSIFIKTNDKNRWPVSLFVYEFSPPLQTSLFVVKLHLCAPVMGKETTGNEMPPFSSLKKKK